MKRNIFALAGLALALLTMSCKEGPTAGEFAVNLTTPFNDDGAIQFTANATTPEIITAISGACSGCKLFLVKVTDGQYKGVLTGQINAGTLFRVGVSNNKVTGSYSVIINSVSNRTFQLRSSTGYSVKLEP